MPEPLVLLPEASSYKLRPITTCGFEVVSGNLVSKNVERHLDESSNYWKERYVHLGARLPCIDMHVIRSNQYVPFLERGRRKPGDWEDRYDIP